MYWFVLFFLYVIWQFGETLAQKVGPFFDNVHLTDC